MDDATKAFLFIIGLLAILAIAAVNMYKWWIRRKHTRERFAFFSVRVFVAFMISAISLLLVRNQVLEVLIGGINAVFGCDIPYAEPTDMIWPSIFILLCSAMLWLLITTMHRSWNGLPSTRQVDFQETGRSINVWKDSQYYWKHRDEIEIYKNKEKTTPEVFSSYEPDTRPWYTKAANLFNLLDQQYNIKEEHWYGEYQCYLSYYGQDNEKLGILCLEESPTPERIDTFVDFIESRSGQFHKLIVATVGTGEKGVLVHRGYKLELRYESEMLDNLIPLSRYRDFIRDYFDQDTLENSSLKLSDIYVPLGGHSVKVEKGKLHPGQSIKSVEQHILKWAKGQRPNRTEHLAILGDYGQGKTVLMHKVVKEMLDHPEEFKRIPILIELRGLSPRNDDELAIFGRWANRFRAKAEALWELHRAGKLFIILDGFDEMDLVGDTELLFNHFTQLWTLARVPNSQVLIAGRPNLFADDEERRMALGIQQPRIHLPYAKAIYLDKLTPGQIEEVLREVQPATRQGILEALDNAGENSSFGELIGRPSTLYQLSTVWDSELAKQKDRLNSATVINSFLHKAYDRQERKTSTVLTSNERHYFMMGIAVAMMMDNAYSNQIKHKSLRRWVEQLWEHYPPKLPPYKDSMQGNKALDYLPNRLLENPDPVDTILKDVRVGGVLVQDISGRDAFKFAHKSYLELLVSAFFSGYVLQSENDRPLLMMVNAITKATGFNQGKLKASPDVEQFTAELIAAQIELMDAQGNPLPVAENPAQYSKSLYKMLILNTYPVRGRFFPNLTGWCSMHPDQNHFLAIGLLAILFILGFFSIQNESWRLGLTIANSLLCWWWAGILLKYRFKKGSMESVKPSDFIFKARLYQKTCRLIKCPVIKLSDTLSLVLKNTHKEATYKKFVLVVLAVFIAFAGAVAVAFLGAVAFTGAFLGVVAVLVATIAALQVAGALAAAFAVAVAVAAAAAVAAAFAVAAAAAVAAAFAVAAAAAVAAAFAVAVAAAAAVKNFSRIRKHYKQAYTALIAPSPTDDF